MAKADLRLLLASGSFVPPLCEFTSNAARVSYRKIPAVERTADPAGDTKYRRQDRRCVWRSR